jgi:CheY-like chemotaxis protein
MKIFVLEDNEERNVSFRKWLAGHDVTYVEDAWTAHPILKNKKFDLIFLDHDLGNRSNVNSDDPNTGYAVAKEIKNGVNKDTQVIVHSMNPNGAINILRVLKSSNNAFHRPFGDWIASAIK